LNNELTEKIYSLNQDFIKEEKKWDEILQKEREKHDGLLG